MLTIFNRKELTTTFSMEERGKIEGIAIKNFGSLKEVVLGRTLSHQQPKPLSNMTTIIGPSGNGKSTVADAFGFIADCLELGVEAACDEGNRGGYEQIISQGSTEPISFELYYREAPNTTPITYELTIALDKAERPYVKEERLRFRIKGIGRPRYLLYLQNGVDMLLRAIREARKMKQAILMALRWRLHCLTQENWELLLWVL